MKTTLNKVRVFSILCLENSGFLGHKHVVYQVLLFINQIMLILRLTDLLKRVSEKFNNRKSLINIDKYRLK